MSYFRDMSARMVTREPPVEGREAAGLQGGGGQVRLLEVASNWCSGPGSAALCPEAAPGGAGGDGGRPGAGRAPPGAGAV